MCPHAAIDFGRLPPHEGPEHMLSVGGRFKKARCVVLSTSEAELRATFFAMRMYGVPAVDFWSIVLERPDLELSFREDNTTMIRIMETGRIFSMRYTTRTLRLPIAWMHERFKVWLTPLKLQETLFSKKSRDSTQ